MRTILLSLVLFASACIDSAPDSLLPGEEEQLNEVEQGLFVYDLPSFGGWGGRYFYDSIAGKGTCSVFRINVHRGRFLDGMSWFMRCANDPTTYGFSIGGAGGTMSSFDLNPGEELVAIHGRAANYIDSIQFQTSWGRFSPYYGGVGGTPYSSVIPPGYRFGGFHGREGSYVDRLGMIAYQP